LQRSTPQTLKIHFYEHYKLQNIQKLFKLHWL
jgi:hypothetical protein